MPNDSNACPNVGLRHECVHAACPSQPTALPAPSAQTIADPCKGQHISAMRYYACRSASVLACCRYHSRHVQMPWSGLMHAAARPGSCSTCFIFRHALHCVMCRAIAQSQCCDRHTLLCLAAGARLRHPEAGDQAGALRRVLRHRLERPAVLLCALSDLKPCFRTS